MNKRRAAILALLGLLTLGVFIYLWVGTRLSAPALRAASPPPPFLKVETVRIRSKSGSELAALHSASDEARAAVVLLHCVRCSRVDLLPRAELLKRNGFAVLAVYPTIEEAVANRIAIRLGPLSKTLAPLLLLQLEPRLGVSPEDLRPIDRIGMLPCPVLVAAGTLDRHTTRAESSRLYEAAPDPKELWLVDGAAHQDLLRYDPDAYAAKVLGFLNRHLGS